MHKGLPHGLWLHTATATSVFLHEDEMLPGELLNDVYSVLNLA
jgi:hypothetical protein